MLIMTNCSFSLGKKLKPQQSAEFTAIHQTIMNHLLQIQLTEHFQKSGQELGECLTGMKCPSVKQAENSSHCRESFRIEVLL
jgi:hypothetical protein